MARLGYAVTANECNEVPILLSSSRLARRWITGMGVGEGDSRSMVDLTVLNKSLGDDSCSPTSVVAAAGWDDSRVSPGLPPQAYS